MKRLVRWLWIRLTGDDPVIVRGHFDTLSALNECHCRFLETLTREHPELHPTIDAHQQERAAACGFTPNAPAETRRDSGVVLQPVVRNSESKKGARQ